MQIENKLLELYQNFVGLPSITDRVNILAAWAIYVKLYIYTACMIFRTPKQRKLIKKLTLRATNHDYN